MSGWQSLDYSYLSSRNNLGYRPFLEVKVDIAGKYLTLYAIVDSGCQNTLINSELAPIFDFILKKPLAKMGGVGGEGKPGYRTVGVLTFPQMNDTAIESPVIFTDFPADMLLGQDSFFKNFEVLFKGRENKFSLRKVKNYEDER